VGQGELMCGEGPSVGWATDMSDAIPERAEIWNPWQRGSLYPSSRVMRTSPLARLMFGQRYFCEEALSPFGYAVLTAWCSALHTCVSQRGMGGGWRCRNSTTRTGRARLGRPWTE
jgi:hypothetical protein